MNSSPPIREGTHFGFILLALYLIVLFFEPQKFIPALEKARLAYSVGIVALVWAFITAPAAIKRALFTSRIFILLMFSFLLYNLSLLFTHIPPADENYAYLECIKSLALFIMTSLSVRSRSDFLRFCWLMIIFTTINTTVTMWYYHLGMLPTRMFSYFGGPGRSGSNEYALLMLQMLPFSIIMLQEKGSAARKLLLAFATLTFLYCLTRTRSRAGFIGLVFIVLSLSYYRFLSRRYFIIMIALVLFIFYKSPTSYFERVKTAGQMEVLEEDTNFTSRTEGYKRALHIIAEYPLFGIGIGNYMPYLDLAYPFDMNKKKVIIHNAFLEEAAECGIITLIIFVALIVLAFTSLRRYSRANHIPQFGNLLNAMSISLISYTWMSMTLSTRADRVFFIILALTVCAGRLIKTAAPQEEHQVA